MSIEDEQADDIATIGMVVSNMNISKRDQVEFGLKYVSFTPYIQSFNRSKDQTTVGRLKIGAIT